MGVWGMGLDVLGVLLQDDCLATCTRPPALGSILSAYVSTTEARRTESRAHG